MSSDASETASSNDPLPAEEGARAHIYRLLAALLAGPPDQKMLALVHDIEPGDGELTEAWRGLGQAARATDSHRLDEEYNKLFIGVGGGELTPYASKYLTGFLMERPLANLRTDLGRLGVVRRDDQREPEDHAAALCETMALLIAGNRLSFREIGDFFETHIGSWLEQFFSDLARAESAEFYAAVGRLGAAFLRVEKVYFSMPV
jgi:TorA maturation chaperone TorD